MQKLSIVIFVVSFHCFVFEMEGIPSIVDPLAHSTFGTNKPKQKTTGKPADFAAKVRRRVRVSRVLREPRKIAMQQAFNRIKEDSFWNKDLELEGYWLKEFKAILGKFVETKKEYLKQAKGHVVIENIEQEFQRIGAQISTLLSSDFLLKLENMICSEVFIGGLQLTTNMFLELSVEFKKKLHFLQIEKYLKQLNNVKREQDSTNKHLGPNEKKMTIAFAALSLLEENGLGSFQDIRNRMRHLSKTIDGKYNSFLSMKNSFKKIPVDKFPEGTYPQIEKRFQEIESAFNKIRSFFVIPSIVQFLAFTWKPLRPEVRDKLSKGTKRTKGTKWFMEDSETGKKEKINILEIGDKPLSFGSR